MLLRTALTAVMGLLVGTSANDAGTVPTPEEIGERIRRTFSQADEGLHLQWTLESADAAHLDKKKSLRGLVLWSVEEFAIKNGSRARWVESDSLDSGEYRTCVYILHDGVLRWQDLDFASRNSKPRPANYHIRHATQDEGLLHDTSTSSQYLEFVGSPFYNGFRLEVWLLHRIREGIRGDVENIDRDFCVSTALLSGRYRVRPHREKVGNVLCWVLEYPGFDKLWLAEDFGFAVVRREWYWSREDGVMCRYENSRFKQISGDLWLPQIARREILELPYNDQRSMATDRPVVFSTVAKLKTASRRVPDGLFSYSPPPGSYAMDNTRWTVDGKSQDVLYEIGATAEATEASLSGALQFLRQKNAETVARNRKRWLFITLNVFGLGAIWVMLKRRRHS